ncbi:MAG TPA: 6,7-dimethyl-8-ribityllumazine synthase [Methylovirgula sp.]|nr:6,7-dimethyl-8-ribityllumazine synthase [Methylovirgula sp.]
MVKPRRSELTEESVEGARFLIVEARFYEDVAAQLHEGAVAALKRAQAHYLSWQVPGALEIPIAMAIALEAAEASGTPFHGALALGCVIRGETAHFEIVAHESARALMDLALARRLPVGNGILTVENAAQAKERADPRRGDKGGDAARAALALYRLKAGRGI